MKTSFLAACLGVVCLTKAQLARYNPGVADITYSFNVPADTAAKGTGDLYFQIKGSASNQWIALGQSNDGQMAGSNIFIIYADASNKNVTLSPRAGLGQFMPLHDTTAKVTLLAGSGIENDVMTANIRCSNCNSWNGGTLSYTSTSSAWIWSQKGGDPIASDAADAQLVQHDEMGSFNIDLTVAQGGSSSNPFVASTVSPSGTSPSGSPSGSSPSSPSATDSGSNVGASGSNGQTTFYAMMPMVLKAHGVVMGSTFVVLLPIGVLIRRILPQSSIWIHAGVQTFSLLLAIAGMGMGIWLATNLDYLHQAHVAIGLVVVCLLCLQPVSGLLQHLYFKKHGRRSVFGMFHVVTGALLILLGVINGGLGLELAVPGDYYRNVYIVVVAVLFSAYFVIISLTLFRSRTQGKSG